jgi:AcrR family transcriptional regulator
MADDPSTDRHARKRRANGEESRRRILDAAAEIAGERGYDGTSIAQVSARCGLPASSIYWHFKDKDELIAAVIERSFHRWLAVFTMPTDGSPQERVTDLAVHIGKALLETPDFLRLGLMLALEHRPKEPSARRMFFQVREIARQRLVDAATEVAPDLAEESLHLLVTYAIAAADGFFIAKEIGGDSVDLIQLFELHAQVLFDAISRLTARKDSETAAYSDVPTSRGWELRPQHLGHRMCRRAGGGRLPRRHVDEHARQLDLVRHAGHLRERDGFCLAPKATTTTPRSPCVQRHLCLPG